ncbi:methionine aminopeptidase, type II [Methanothermus fervidus DSM 2088]|uniref:Methionine aminopeptidase n=1 Tax=Methanothermus fervidus (strain ATCC 43054 / DSM 2088 / JCM 10308 / V24 S) TaxID=523846 RepID=E3GW93_METFV|nr:methionine aminopeptidase, type II [Methanothermus fervidus DSM 2088]
MEKFKKAGKIASKVRKKAIKAVKGEMKILDLAEFIENEIEKMGAKPAFPCNISVNEITAHYSPPCNDDRKILPGDLVKIDIGVHVDGFIGDTATTVLVEGYEDLKNYNDELAEKNKKMIEAAESALENAINTIRDGVEIGKIGEVIENTINKFGFKPISNLTGHSIDRWVLHSGLSIPNVKGQNSHKLREGDVVAIEPFATDGVGYVVDKPETYIFRFLRDRPVRDPYALRVLRHVKKEYRTLPFAERWLEKKLGSKGLKHALKVLIRPRIIYPYHVLKEKSDSWVSQAEHTVLVEKDACVVLTE